MRDTLIHDRIIELIEDIPNPYKRKNAKAWYLQPVLKKGLRLRNIYYEGERERVFPLDDAMIVFFVDDEKYIALGLLIKKCSMQVDPNINELLAMDHWSLSTMFRKLVEMKVITVETYLAAREALEKESYE